jgi:NAD-dependent dihydropyrimidine dehydrogenase PreA subunit
VIEILNADRCTECDICVRICPTNVFDTVEGGVPVIARHSDCQTCFQCEAYCPADAIFVAPSRIPLRPDSPLRDEDALLAAGQLGLYRERVGWRTTPVASPAPATAPLPSSTIDYHRTVETLHRSTS